jgi:phosphate transporter
MSSCNPVASYDGLKKYIYQLERQQSGLDTSYHDLEASENSSLIGGVDNDKNFIKVLDQQLNKITLFYTHQEKEILGELRELEELVRQQDDSGFSGRDNYLAFDDDDDDDDDEEEDGEEEVSRSPDQTASTSRTRRRSVSFSTVAQNPGLFLLFLFSRR